MPATVEGRPTERNARGKAPEGGWQAGQLVDACTGYNNCVVVGRLRRAPLRGEAGLTLTGTGNTWYAETYCLRFLSDTPADDPEPTLNTRRNNLLRNLEEARKRLYTKQTPLGRTHSSLIYQLSETLTGYDRRGEHAWFWQTLAESADNPRQVSYAATIEDVDNNARRKRCSWKKLLERARLYGSPFSPEGEAVIANLIGQQFPANYNFTFEVVSGKGVVDAYSDPTPHWGSCMHNLLYPNFYAINPDKVASVRISQGNKPAGRALLWTADDGSRIVDRCYPSDGGPQMVALHAWAREQGYDFKAEQSYRAGGLDSGRNDYRITMRTHAPPVGRAPGYDARREGYPFIDTFKYAPEEPAASDTLTLSMQTNKAKFESTSGKYTYDRYIRAGDDPDEEENEDWDDDNNDEESISCNWCGGNITDGDERSDSNGSLYCQDCFTTHLREVDYTENGVVVQGLYSADNVTDCRDCRQLRLRRHLRPVAGAGSFCPACLANHETDNCPICSRLALRSDLTRGCCINCYPMTSCTCSSCVRTRRILAANAFLTANQG